MIQGADEKGRAFVRPVLRLEELGRVVEVLVEHLPLDVTCELGFGRIRCEHVHAEWLWRFSCCRDNPTAELPELLPVECDRRRAHDQNSLATISTVSR